MRDTDRQELIRQITHGTTHEREEAVTPAAEGVRALVVAALLASSGADLLADARRLATSTADRQLVAIAAAYVDGDLDRADALARDHLLDHAPQPVVAWIIARCRPDAPDRPPPAPGREA
jgi:hypothetical protein